MKISGEIVFFTLYASNALRLKESYGCDNHQAYKVWDSHSRAGVKRYFLGEVIKHDAAQNLRVYMPKNRHLSATSKLRRRLHGWLQTPVFTLSAPEDVQL